MKPPRSKYSRSRAACAGVICHAPAILDINPWPVEKIVAVRIHHFFDRTRLNPRQSPHASHELPVRLRIIRRPSLESPEASPFAVQIVVKSRKSPLRRFLIHLARGQVGPRRHRRLDKARYSAVLEGNRLELQSRSCHRQYSQEETLTRAATPRTRRFCTASEAQCSTSPTERSCFSASPAAMSRLRRLLDIRQERRQ